MGGREVSTKDMYPPPHMMCILLLIVMGGREMSTKKTFSKVSTLLVYYVKPLLQGRLLSMCAGETEMMGKGKSAAGTLHAEMPGETSAGTKKNLKSTLHRELIIVNVLRALTVENLWQGLPAGRAT
jgi:hypothetical protein